MIDSCLILMGIGMGREFGHKYHFRTPLLYTRRRTVDYRRARSNVMR